MNRSILLSVWAVVLAAGCGGTVNGSGGGGGEGGSGTTSTLPAECVVETEETAPHKVTFQFTGTGTTTVYMREECTFEYKVTSCGDGYQEGLALTGQCTIDCAEKNQCLECGACLEQPVAVNPESTLLHAWAGHTYTFDENNVGCRCHVKHVAPAGKYRITVPVWATEEEAAANGPPAAEVSVDFDLPAPGGVVEVPLALP